MAGIPDEEIAMVKGDLDELVPSSGRKSTRPRAAALFACAALLVTFGVVLHHVGALPFLATERSADFVGLARKHFGFPARKHFLVPARKHAKHRAQEELPQCLKDMHNPLDLKACGEAMLKKLKSKGGSDYDYAVAENMLTGKPLPPKMLAMQMAERTAAANLAAKKALDQAKEQPAAMATMAKMPLPKLSPGDEELPECLKDMHNPLDLKACGQAMLKKLKRKGGSDYDYAVAENMLSGKPLPPKMLAMQMAKRTAAANLAAKKALHHAKEQAAAMTTMAKVPLPKLSLGGTNSNIK